MKKAVMVRSIQELPDTKYFLNLLTNTVKIPVKNWVCGQSELSFSQLLTLDFYLRENAKNRPPFSQDNSKYKNIIKDFYKSEMAREKLPRIRRL